jgi:cytochrome b
MTTIESDQVSAAGTCSAPGHFRKVWDWPVRLFHWSLVAALIGAYVTNKLGATYFGLHLFFGYTTIALVVFRVVWGFIGTRHARFEHFVERPLGVLRYVSALGRGRRTHYVGHNPLGALMVLALLSLFGAQAVFGLFGDDEILNAGPLAALVSKDVSLLFTSLHRRLFYVILGAVALHIGAVLVHVVFRREPLIQAMIHGGKPGDLVAPEEAIKSSNGLRALLLITSIGVLLAIAHRLAPSAANDFTGF